MSENTLAHYEILSLLGRGGMGEVHRARDTKLGREVALKLLPQDFSADPERLARFRREAKVLASLHHPNIAGIFGIEEDQGRVFLVMELAEGDDLSVRIAKGPVPEEEALDIARQLAAGLEEAHEKGVVHRDLKPANIKLGSDGKVRILDFGLARAFAGETAEEEHLENSPTITAAMSKGGVILGTAAYMSPEQARGRKVDRRADIWAFGAVLYEILTGKRLFEGETISDTLAAVLRADIEWNQLPEGTSPGMRRLLERCLERDPLKRLRDIGEARIFLESGAMDSSLLASSASMVSGMAGEYAGASGRRGLPVWATIAIAAVLGVAGTLVGWQVLGRPQPPQVFNTAIPAPAGGSFNLFTSRPGPAAISPDGTMVAYAARDESGTILLHLRHLDRPAGTALAGTDGATYPFWSPDSRFIGFASGDRKLKKVAVTGGPPITLCPADNMKGGTWNKDGVILFAPSHDSGIFRVPATGGTPVEIIPVEVDSSGNSNRHPRFLPDGNQFLFLVRVDNARGEHHVYLGSLDGGAPQLISTSEAAAEYSAGHLLTVREGILLATPFDPAAGALGEDVVPLTENILLFTGGAACALYSSTLEGMLLYQVSISASEQTLIWSGEGGRQLGTIGEPAELARPRVSPDGTQAVVEIQDLETDTADLWLVNLESGLRSRFTFDPGDEGSAVWTPDGSAIVYVARVDSTRRFVMQPVEGTGGTSILFETTNNAVCSEVTPDGKSLMVSMDKPGTSWDLYSLSIETGELEPLVTNESAEFWGVVSPDGRWMSYTRATTGSFEIMVRPLAGGERQWQVDRAGGLYSFWGPDGKTLLYCEFSGAIVAVPVDGSGSTFRAGAPQPFTNASSPVGGGLHVSLHPDGDRILQVSGEISEDETVGSALCRRLIDEGATVVAVARDGAKLREQFAGIPVVASIIDPLRPEEIETCLQEVRQRHGALHGVANCIGSLLLKPAHITTDEEWSSVLTVNLTTSFHIVRAAVRTFAAPGGSIVLVSSAAAQVGLANHEAIAAAKAGVVGLCLAASASYAARGIRVNCVSPGLTRTPLTARITASEASLKATTAMHALGRIGEAADVASAIAWLLDPEQSWVTGQTLGVDGGLARIRPKG